jgi:hypothetical protein
MKRIKSGHAGAVALAAFLAYGCSSSSGDGTGTLNIGLTDGPVESAEAVVVAFTGVELKPASGNPLDPIPMNADTCDNYDTVTETCSIDILSLTGSDRKVVISESLPAGEYQWIRLMVNAEQNVMDSYIEFADGSMCSLWIPSGSDSGLKIHNAVIVTANGVSDYTLDFDVRNSVTAPPGFATGTLAACTQNYVMRPTIRMIDTTQAGHIVGTVDGDLLTGDDGCTTDEFEHVNNAAVYVFENFNDDAVADDLDDDGTYPDPVTSARVVWNDSPDILGYEYEAGYLLASENYLVALTCTADIDDAIADQFDPDSAESQDISFIAERSVQVEVESTADGSFPASP